MLAGYKTLASNLPAAMEAPQYEKKTDDHS